MKQILLLMIGLSVSVYADFSNENGVVIDSKTTLQWQDDYSDNGGDIKIASWTEAIDYCEALNLEGTGWRLPNKKELLSIVDYSTYSPSINSFFTNTTSYYYWSSTTYASNSSSAWVVHFYDGSTNGNSKTNSNTVRCVRAGQ